MLCCVSFCGREAAQLARSRETAVRLNPANAFNAFQGVCIARLCRLQEYFALTDLRRYAKLC